MSLMFSPIVGYTLSNGRHISSGDLTEEDFSIEFLTKKLGGFMESCNINFFFKTLYLQKRWWVLALCPYKTGGIKWFMHTNTDDEERNEFPNETSNILLLTIMMLMRLLKYEFIIDGVAYELYTEQLVAWDSEELCLSYPIVTRIDSISYAG